MIGRGRKLSDQYRKQIGCMKQIQGDIKEMKHSIESGQKYLNKSEDGPSHNEVRMLANITKGKISSK